MRRTTLFTRSLRLYGRRSRLPYGITDVPVEWRYSSCLKFYRAMSDRETFLKENRLKAVYHGS